jgi:hypothetical protein
LLFDPTDHQESTLRCQASILVQVHPGSLPIMLASVATHSLTGLPRVNNLHSFDTSTRHSPKAKASSLLHSPSGKVLAGPTSPASSRLGYLAPDITQAILDGRQPRSLTPEKLLEHSRLPHDPLIVPGKHRFTARSSWRTPRRRRATSDSSSRPGWSIMMPRSEKSIRMSTKDGTSNNDRASSLLQKINFSS